LVIGLLVCQRGKPFHSARHITAPDPKGRLSILATPPMQ